MDAYCNSYTTPTGRSVHNVILRIGKCEWSISEVQARALAESLNEAAKLARVAKWIQEVRTIKQDK